MTWTTKKILYELLSMSWFFCCIIPKWFAFVTVWVLRTIHIFFFRFLWRPTAKLKFEILDWKLCSKFTRQREADQCSTNLITPKGKNVISSVEVKICNFMKYIWVTKSRQNITTEMHFVCKKSSWMAIFDNKYNWISLGKKF